MRSMRAYNEDVKSVPAPAQAIRKRFRPRQICIEGQTLTTTPAFDAYWYFATARQNIFHARVSHRNSYYNYFNDHILREFRFTNAYRASDRVSQYLIREVIDGIEKSWSNENLFFRTMLFKIFNKIDTWEALRAEFGEISIDRFDFSSFDHFLTDRQNSNCRNYSAAYIMPSAGGVFGHTRKHSNHLALLQWMLDKEFPKRLNQMDNMAEAYTLMLSAPSLGPFLAYQFVTDLNYSSLTDFSEMEFVVAGPGALDGISKCFEGAERVSAESIIAHMTNCQIEYFSAFGHEFQDLWGRSLQLIDCQNLFCEISKYTRVAFPEILGVLRRSRIKQKYRQSEKPIQKPRYPEKWGINAWIDTSCKDRHPSSKVSLDYRNQGSFFEGVF